MINPIGCFFVFFLNTSNTHFTKMHLKTKCSVKGEKNDKWGRFKDNLRGMNL